jgi:hypothetical protein
MRAVKALFVAALLALSVLPALEMLHPFVTVPSLTENRYREPPPDLAGILRGDGRLSGAINRWFDDHYGFRDLLIRLKHEIDYRAFRHSDKIYIGGKGWLYERDFLDQKVSMERRGDGGERALERQFLRLAAYLSRRGIELVILADPMKATIYPQFLPYDAPRLPPRDRFQELRGFLASRPEWIFVDSQDALRRCSRYPTYHQIDIHRTYYGSLCVARRFVERMGAAEGRPASIWRSDVPLRPVRTSQGGQVEFLGAFSQPAETAYVPSDFYGMNSKLSDGALTTDPARVYEWIYHAAPAARGGKLPAMVWYGNSFLDHFLALGAFDYFADVYRARDNGRNLAEVLRDIPAGTRYFLFQFLEPQVAELIDEEIPGD